MEAKQTTYIDESGNKRTGYFIDGHTYQDEAGTTPISVGSVVDTGGGKYIMTDQGGQLYDDYLEQNNISQVNTQNINSGTSGIGYVKNGVTYTDPMLQNRIGSGTVVNGSDGRQWIKTDSGSMLYSDYLRQQESAKSVEALNKMMRELETAYQSALAANDQQYAAQLEQQKLAVQSRIDALNRGYKDLNKQLYRDYMRNQKNLPQALAAQGITGGLAESSLVNLAAGYEGDLSENERQRLAGVTDLKNGVTGAQLQLSIAQAQANQQAADTRYDRLAAILAAQQEQANYEKQMEAEAENLAYTRALNEAKIAAELGDQSKLYAITGAQQPETAAPPVYQPTYNPAPAPTTTPTRDLSGFVQEAKNVLYYGEDAVIRYLNNRVANGILSQAEADVIAQQL